MCVIFCATTVPYVFGAQQCTKQEQMFIDCYNDMMQLRMFIGPVRADELIKNERKKLALKIKTALRTHDKWAAARERELQALKQDMQKLKQMKVLAKVEKKIQNDLDWVEQEPIDIREIHMEKKSKR